MDFDLRSIIVALHELGESEKKTKRCWGFPIHTTFKSLDHLRELVLATKVHAINRQDVEFVLSVHLQSYSCNILSVWVFLVAYVDVEEAYR